MPNVAAWVVFQYALAKLGAILIIRLAKLKALVAVPKYKNSNYVDIICSIIPEVRENKGEINCKDFPHLHHIIFASDELSLPPGAVNLKSLMEDSAAAEPNIELPNLDSGDIINIQFTSGTTGTPKGVALTHDNIVNNARFVAERQRLTKGDVVCIPVPLYHCFGIVMGNLACLAEGATALFSSPTFEPGSSLASVEKHGAVALYGVPTMFTAMLQHPQFQKVDLSSLRTGIMAGSPCPISVMEKVTKFIPAITVCYGMTETGPVSFQTLPNSPIEARTSTVGYIMPHTHSRVLKLRGNEAALIGETGRLQIKGYLVMHSYWNDDESTKKVIDAEGWMDTGDLASIDKEGYCRIVGRSKDMVIRGGENIYPTEIENLLLRHPSILDVSVIGVPDEKFGEELCAFYIPSDKPVPNHGFREEFKGSFAHYKIPIYFISVDKFPTTVSGKVKKFELRKMALARLNLSSSKN
ncbi:hypothetical protein L0F63_003941 [Massospora cicadina]|nr:hypothetical protein L0F63_003941 [Massospora cicadina]